MISGYLTFTSFSQTDGLLTDPQILGRHTNRKQSEARKTYLVFQKGRKMLCEGDEQ